MSDDVTLQEAKEGLEPLGMWMDTRYSHRFVDIPIQKWDVPRKEKGFFTVYAMNLVLESDGFGCFIEQKPEDVDAFIDMLHRLGAKKTSAFVRRTVAAFKSDTSCDEVECTREYYDLYEREKVWLKLVDYVGRRVFGSYLLKARAIEEAGGNTFDPKQWEGQMPSA